MKKAMCLLSMTVLLALVSGCATTGKGMSDEEMIQLTLDTWGAGLVEKDLEKFLSTISESFSAPQAADKETLGNFIQQAIEAGYIDDAEVTREDAQYTIEGDTCSVYPVDLMSSAGAVAVELQLTKEEDQWLVTGLEIDGI